MQRVSIHQCMYAGLTLALAGALACGRGGGGDADTTRAGASPPCGDESIRIAEQLVSRMRLVSVLGPDSVVSKALTEAFASLATPELLASWKAKPSAAPGREVSNPWPARLEIKSAEPDGEECRVEGTVAYVTTADTLTPVEHRPVSIRVRNDNGWKVSAFALESGGSPRGGSRPAPGAADTTAGVADSALTPAHLVLRYYDAIQKRNFDSAYAMWSDGGRASGQSREAFERGFAQTARVRAAISDSVKVEGAAGSQYATVPVIVDSRLRNGKQQHFAGTYILRRSMVDGATEAQRHWHIYSASMRPR